MLDQQLIYWFTFPHSYNEGCCVWPMNCGSCVTCPTVLKMLEHSVSRQQTLSPCTKTIPQTENRDNIPLEQVSTDAFTHCILGMKLLELCC